MNRKRIYTFLAALLVLPGLSLSAQTIESTTFENGGGGPYKAIMTHDAQFEAFTLYRPADLQAAARGEGGSLPVILYANGGCRRSSEGYQNFLTELASQGYMIVAVGRYVDSGTRGESVQTHTLEERKSDSQSLVEALDLLEKLNTDPGSEFYQTLDCRRVSTMGHSCGGLEAIYLGISGDTRIKTMVIMNSGIIVRQGEYLSDLLAKDDLKKIPFPYIYLIGGEGDMAHKNAIDDFRKVSHVPVVFANYPAGHGGTYRRAGGGAFAEMARAWLDYRLKGKTENEKIFKFCDNSGFPGWTIESKNFDYASKSFSLNLDGTPSEVISEGDKYTRNAVGEIDSITSVSNPTITVFLPDPNKANGTAVIVCSGGGLRSHDWDGDVLTMVHWLNRRGIAAIGLKYRVRQYAAQAEEAARQARPEARRPRPSPEKGPAAITRFQSIEKGNANPDKTPLGAVAIEEPVEDALKAVALIREHAEEWKIDKNRIGILGFSAGGGVAVGSVLKGDEATRPNFAATVFGPSLMDVEVPADAPDLFIATRARHGGVAPGLLSLFLLWQEAGAKAEMHIYDDGQNAFPSQDSGLPSGTWLTSFNRWLDYGGYLQKPQTRRVRQAGENRPRPERPGQNDGK